MTEVDAEEVPQTVLEWPLVVQLKRKIIEGKIDFDFDQALRPSRTWVWNTFLFKDNSNSYSPVS